MRYEEPNMEILMLNVEVIVTTSLNGKPIGKDDDWNIPDDW